MICQCVVEQVYKRLLVTFTLSEVCFIQWMPSIEIAANRANSLVKIVTYDVIASLLGAIVTIVIMTNVTGLFLGTKSGQVPDSERTVIRCHAVFRSREWVYCECENRPGAGSPQLAHRLTTRRGYLVLFKNACMMACASSDCSRRENCSNSA